MLRGNLAPDGAIIKPAAASPGLLRAPWSGAGLRQHRGRSTRGSTTPSWTSTPDTVLVLRGCGPRGYPGMPEVGNLPLPRQLLEQGVRDMVRISDGRMSGTAYGTVVLHVAPESAAGGPLARSADRRRRSPSTCPPARLDVGGGPRGTGAAREPSPAATAAHARPVRGWERLYVDHVLQADRGADLDFLVGRSGSEVSRESH